MRLERPGAGRRIEDPVGPDADDGVFGITFWLGGDQENIGVGIDHVPERPELSLKPSKSQSLKSSAKSAAVK